MREAELEAAIWRAIRLHRVTVPNAARFMDDLLALALAYAAGDGPEVTMARRVILDQETAK